MLIPTKEGAVTLTPGMQPPLRVEQALRLLPDVDDLAPLRGFVVSLSSIRGPEGWMAAEPNRTIGKRTLDPASLRAQVPQVLSHVTGRVAAIYAASVDALEAEQNGDFYTVRIGFPAELARYLVYKGSVSVEGISLTIAALADDSFDIAVIPKTWELTNLASLSPGDAVNLEVDVIAKYVERMMNAK